MSPTSLTLNQSIVSREQDNQSISISINAYQSIDPSNSIRVCLITKDYLTKLARTCSNDVRLALTSQQARAVLAAVDNLPESESVRDMAVKLYTTHDFENQTMIDHRHDIIGLTDLVHTSLAMYLACSYS